MVAADKVGKVKNWSRWAGVYLILDLTYRRNTTNFRLFVDMNKGKISYHRFDLLIDYSPPVQLSDYMSDKIGTVDIADFLSKNGAMGVLLIIDKEKGTLHSEFKNNLHVSRATVTNRLETANELDLIEVSRLPDDHGNSKRYVLTEMGRVLRVALESKGLVETYQQYVELEQALERANGEMIEWVHDTDEIWAEKTFASEFTFRDKFKSEDTFPGDDVPDGFDSYIEGELSIREKTKRYAETKEKTNERELKDSTTPSDSVAQDDDDDDEDGDE